MFKVVQELRHMRKGFLRLAEASSDRGCLFVGGPVPCHVDPTVVLPEKHEHKTE